MFINVRLKCVLLCNSLMSGGDNQRKNVQNQDAFRPALSGVMHPNLPLIVEWSDNDIFLPTQTSGSHFYKEKIPVLIYCSFIDVLLSNSNCVFSLLCSQSER